MALGRFSPVLLLLLVVMFTAASKSKPKVRPGCDPRGLKVITTCEYTKCKHCITDKDCCKKGQICCKWGCGKRCFFPKPTVRPGCDPRGLEIITTCEYTKCKHCITDRDCCKKGQICCKWGCGKRCFFPKPTVRPGCDPRGLKIFTTCEYTKCKHCITDKDCCRKGQICCKWGCGKRCFFPIKG